VAAAAVQRMKRLLFEAQWGEDRTASVVAARKARLIEAQLGEIGPNGGAAVSEWRKSLAVADHSRPCPGHGLPYY
jgi:hypothetical protein